MLGRLLMLALFNESPAGQINETNTGRSEVESRRSLWVCCQITAWRLADDRQTGTGM